MEDSGEVIEVTSVLSEAAEWDARYNERDQVWSGEPNGALVAELTGAPPGRALDVGCGEGADALWLARQGWAVTALDVSQVALDRAAAHAADQNTDVTWVCSGLLDADLPADGFDLVSAQYPALRSTADHAAVRALVSAVAPGGILLVVHHDMRDGHAAREHGFDPDDWVAPGDVAALLDTSWHIDVNEVRERSISGGSGAHHTHDVVLRAHRLPQRSLLVGRGQASGSLGVYTEPQMGTAMATAAPASLAMRAQLPDGGCYWDHREARWINSRGGRGTGTTSPPAG
ncbi:class I SAM-dependent methyltransferase [Rhodococcus sp. NPDC019627]|uniref:class I SAM-dependent methyltransferase n=1 Tax=unclassified Rhodococcus (in: high G+C Gram-positive bacteria) TaxID=192944 RepID=UPI0033D6F96A